MKHRTVVVLVLIVAICFLVGLFCFFAQNSTYVPISTIIPELSKIRNLECEKISMQFSDNSSEGKGSERTKLLTDSTEKHQILNLLLQTFCCKSKYEQRDGDYIISITFYFSNHESIVVHTYASGGILFNGNHYITNNQLGTYIANYLRESFLIS